MPTEVVLPMLGITVERGKIIEWLKKEGDKVEKGEIIFIVEVEKATTEVESPASGILAKILVEPGKEVPVLTPVAIIAQPGEKIDAATPAFSPAQEPEAAAAQIEAMAAPAAKVPSEFIMAVPAARKLANDKGIDLTNVCGTGPDGVIMLKDVEALASGQAAIERVAKPAAAQVSPLAQKMAEEKGVSLDQVEGTGVRGRIMRSDVERAATSQAAAAPAAAVCEAKIVPMDTMRKIIARRMSESKFTAPHIYFFTDVDMDPIMNFRKELLPDFEKKYQIRPSLNDFLIKATALTLVDFPIMNSKLVGDDIHILPDVNVCLAVALPQGLIVPALEKVHTAGLVDIVNQRTDLVNRAKAGKLTMKELERGTFTISSLAQFDIKYFTAIINPPQVGILSMGKTREELTLRNGEVVAKSVATIGVSVDHRVIDGAVAADFLQNLKWKLERPTFTFLTL